MHGLLPFHLSGGDPVGDVIAGDRDVKPGGIGAAGFRIGPSRFAYRKHARPIIDMAPDRGGLFSRGNGEGARLFSDDGHAAPDAAGRAWPGAAT